MAKTAEEILQDKAETATYIDADGQKQTGTVASDIKAALGTDNYYSKTADTYGQILEAQKQENAAAAADADAAALSELQRQTEKVNTEYGKTDKQLYRGYRTAVRDLPQQLAAMGITGGLSETSRVDLERGYGENLNASQLQRLAAIDDMEAANEAAKREREAALRQQNAAATQNYYTQLLGLGEQKYAEDQARQKQSAETLASMGDFSGYVALGLMTDAQAKKAQKAWIAQNPELAALMGYVKASSGGGRRYYGDGGKTMEEAYGELDERAKAFVNAAISKGSAEETEKYLAEAASRTNRAPEVTQTAYKNAVSYINKYLS